MTAKQRVTVRMPEVMGNILTRKAEKLGVSKNSLILQILWERIKEERSERCKQDF